MIFDIWINENQDTLRKPRAPSVYIYTLFGGLEHECYFSIIYGNVIFPTDEVIFFRRGRHTTNQYIYIFGWWFEAHPFMVSPWDGHGIAFFITVYHVSLENLHPGFRDGATKLGGGWNMPLSSCSRKNGGFMGFYSDLMGFYTDSMGYSWDIPSGKQTVLRTWKWPFSSLWRMVIFHSYVRLPEGMTGMIVFICLFEVTALPNPETETSGCWGAMKSVWQHARSPWGPWCMQSFFASPWFKVPMTDPWCWYIC